MNKLGFSIANRYTRNGDSANFKQRIDFAYDLLTFVFGVNWLNKPIKSKDASEHPLQKIWIQIKKLQSRNQITQFDVNSFKDPTKLGTYIPPLSLAHELKGFREYVLPRLKHPVEFKSALFEMVVAAKYCTNMDLTVEFIKPESINGLKTADLQLVNKQEKKMIIECKRKVRTTLPMIHKAKIQSLFEDVFGSFRFGVENSLDITFAIVGKTNLQEMRMSFEYALDLVRNNILGYNFDGSVEIGIVITQKPAVFTPKINSDYTFEYSSGELSITYHCIFLEGTNWSSIKNSLKSASSQLNRNELNLVAVQLELQKANIEQSSAQLYLYMKMITDLAKSFWRGQLNTRIKGIIFVVGPFDRTVYETDIFYKRTSTNDYLITNKDSDLEFDKIGSNNSSIFRIFDQISGES